MSKPTIYETSKNIAPDIIRTVDRRAAYFRRAADLIAADPLGHLVRFDAGRKLIGNLWVKRPLEVQPSAQVVIMDWKRSGNRRMSP